VTAMKSVKVLRLTLHLAGVVPGVAELAAAADVGVDHDDTAVEQREARGEKPTGSG
jgi:hypothetical protein